MELTIDGKVVCLDCMTVVDQRRICLLRFITFLLDKIDYFFPLADTRVVEERRYSGSLPMNDNKSVDFIRIRLSVK